MKKSFFAARLSVGYLNQPDKDNGERNPYTTNDPGQCFNPFVKSADVEIPEEVLPALLEFLEGKGLYTGDVRGLEFEEAKESFFDENGYIIRKSI